MAAPSPLPTQLRHRVSVAVSMEGLAAFVARSGSSERAVLRAVAGLPVRKGTEALLESALRSTP